MGDLISYRKFLSWDVIEDYCVTIKSQLKERKMKFDVIVPIVRGGLVPASILSHLTDVKTIVPIQWQTRDGDQKRGKRRFKKEVLSEYKKILIVDDLIDSGKTLTEVFDYVDEFSKKKSKIEVHSAVLLYNTACNVKINPRLNSTVFARYYSSTKSISYWWDFPWEVASS